METVLCFHVSTEVVSMLKPSVVRALFLAACTSSTAKLKFRSVPSSLMRRIHPRKDSSPSITATIQHLYALEKELLLALIIRSGSCSKQVSRLIILYLKRLAAFE